MPVPTWDCPELVMMDEPVDTTTVVSEDIWKKFDLDFPQPFPVDRYYGTIEDVIIHESYDRGTTSSSSSSTGYEKSLGLSTSSRLDAREIRHHDCMWAGLCISKEHNRTHPAKKDVQIRKSKVPAGRSLLINRKNHQIQQQQGAGGNCNGIIKSLESDGDSTRPETPQSCDSESDESDDEIPRFKHDSISINDKLSEYIGGYNPSAITVPVSEVTGQLVCRKVYSNDQTKINDKSINHTQNRRVKIDNVKQNQRQDVDRTTNNANAAGYTGNTSIVSLGDHCYHLNQTSSSKKLEHLGVQTPSDSEEEIDVVSFDKPCRPASLPTNPSLADKHNLQKTVTSAFKDKSSSSSSSSASSSSQTPRPRGRPPSNATRKRSAQTELKSAKRPKHKTGYQKRNVKPCTSGITLNTSNVYNNSNNNNNNNNNNSNNNNNKNNVDFNTNNKYNRNNNVAGVLTGDNNRLSTTVLQDSNVKIDPDVRHFERNNNNNSSSSSSNNNNNNSSKNNNERNDRSDNKIDSNIIVCNKNGVVNNTRSISSDDEPDTEKRSLHNNMERQRRIELRNAFEELRVLVPEVEMKEKAPKVVILRQAAVYCDILTEIGRNTLATVNDLKRKQDRLRNKLSQLRRNFRSERRGVDVRNHDRRSLQG